MPNTVDGLRKAWSIVERTWRSTFGRAKQLPESVLHENVNGEWSFVETQRHLLFVTDVWVRGASSTNPVHGIVSVCRLTSEPANPIRMVPQAHGG